MNRRILRFSVSIGMAGAFLAALAYVASAYPDLSIWRGVNLRALSEINCRGATCDTSAFLNDWQSDAPDYIVDMQSLFLIAVATPTTAEPGRFAQLDYSDTTFIARFRQPATYATPDGEVWRLCSRAVLLDGRSFEIMVGYALKAHSKAVGTSNSPIGDVDAVLNHEADEIARSPVALRLVDRPPSRSGFSADGFQVVDPTTEQVVEQGPWLPTFLPRGVPLPAPGLEFYIHGGSLYVAQTETNGRLLATSLIPIGGLWWIVGSCALGFAAISVVTRALSRRFLRNYLAFTEMRVPSLEEALRIGEGQSVEFKRGLSDDPSRTGNVEDEFLRSIAAFANTNDGVIFVGIDDAGHVKGLELDFAGRDRLEQRINQLIRNRIKPVPAVRITFEDVRGFAIARVAVPRGQAPVYLMAGTVYVRYGSSDVQAQPEDLKRLVSEYAF